MRAGGLDGHACGRLTHGPQKQLAAYVPPALATAMIKQLAWHLSRPWLAVATGNGVFLYKSATAQWLPAGFAPCGVDAHVLVTAIAWRPAAGDTLAVACDDGRVHLWSLDMTGREPPASLDLGDGGGDSVPGPIHVLAWSPDGR